MSIIPALGRLRWEDCEFEVSLGYIMRPCPKKARKKREKGCYEHLCEPVFSSANYVYVYFYNIL
jgi:hypothetical protein